MLATPLGTGIRPVSHEALAGRTIGKKAIYFATRRVVPDSQAGGTAGQRMAAPMQFSLVSTPARQGPVDNPLPIAELQSVMNAALIKGHDTEDPNCF